MNDAYQQFSKMLDNWLSDSVKDIKMALIEKDILLDKMRKLYVKISGMETEEYDAPQPESLPASDQSKSESKKQYTQAKTLEEDVELFFDTEHESYKAVEQELKNIAEEINETQGSSKTPKPESGQKEKPVPETDIFDQIEQTEEDKGDGILKDDAEKLFDDPDIEITVQSEEPAHAEDDILQFLPQKNAPEVPVAEKTVPVTPKPVEQPKVHEPIVKPQMPKQEAVNQPVKAEKQMPAEPAEAPVQKPQQKSLNDLFNEQREDHSISSQYQRAKVGDLTKAISINDKFIYIKELFHNRGEDFSASIRLLNECHNMEEAFNCLDELKKKYYWDSKSDAYLSFCDLLRRKFS